MFLGAFISVTTVLFGTGQARRKIGVRILKCLVEMTRVELVSENIFTPASTGVGCKKGFPSYKLYSQSLYYGSFIVHDSPRNKRLFTFTTDMRLVRGRGTPRQDGCLI